MKHQIELRHMRYFLAVAEELHFRKASDRLFISQPGLSRQIKQMEEDLGVELFERANKKVKLTIAGEYLKGEVSLILKNIDNVFEHTQLLDKGIVGKIHMGYVGSAMQKVIPDLLLATKSRDEEIQFSLKEMDNPKQVRALLSQEIDVGFVRVEKAPEDIRMHPIFEDTFSLVLPKDHPIDESNFKDLIQLKDESFILIEPSYSPDYYEKIMTIFKLSGFTPKVSHNSVHASTIYKLIENGLGVSIVPTILKQGYNMDVKFVELKKIPMRTILSVAWNKNNRNPMLKVVLSYFENRKG